MKNSIMNTFIYLLIIDLNFIFKYYFIFKFHFIFKFYFIFKSVGRRATLLWIFSRQ